MTDPSKKALSTDHEGDDILRRAVVPPTIADRRKSFATVPAQFHPLHSMLRLPFFLLLTVALPIAGQQVIVQPAPRPILKALPLGGDDDITNYSK